MSIEISRKQIRISGRPRIVVSGEIHYFRVERDQWRDRIRSARDAGCTAVASYLPWLVHELPDGTIDVTGTARPENDIGAFIDLCRDKGLDFIVRPGPFVMAELKNEGLPYRLYTDHPQIVPVGWDGVPAPSKTVDYLAPEFLAEVRRWYGAVCPIIADRLPDRGGRVIAFQLDNEIGMLAWVTNSPDLTEDLIADFARWAGPVGYPLDVDSVRSPDEKWAGALRLDLSRFMRDRFARYASALREMATDNGITGIPFLINIHGTEGGGGESFPIGISQLVETYSGIPGMISGSDHYVGDMTLSTTTDLYVMNAFSDAVHGPDQPLTSLEFEAGSGDYAGGNDQQYDPSTVDLKTRLFVAQGNRLINYYLFAGGINPPLYEPVGDGNDRISFTGRRHGTAAPVGPEGQRSGTYQPTADVIHAVAANEPWLAQMREEHDDLVLGFVPDSYLTEYHRPGSAAMAEIVQDLVRLRGAGPRRALARSLLLAGYRFGAVDLQRADPECSVLALVTAEHMDPNTQARVAAHVRCGGKLLLLGRIPTKDLTGAPCTVLADTLGITPGRMVWQDRYYYPSVTSPELPVGWLQEIDAPGAEALLTDTMSGKPCAVAVNGAILLCAELPSDPVLFGGWAQSLGAAPGLARDTASPGLFATSTVDDDGGRLIHFLNVSGYRTQTRWQLQGRDLFGGRPVTLPPRTGRMLPVGLRTPAAHIVWSTAEITAAAPGQIGFDAVTGEEAALLLVSGEVRSDLAARMQPAEGGVLVEFRQPGRHTLRLTP